MEINKLLAGLGHKNLLSEGWYKHINLWLDWYGGKAKFHKYTVYNGEKKVSCTRKTLGMAKQVSEDKADLLLNEKVNITLTKQQEYLAEVLDRNNFWVRGNQLIEIAHATGTGAFVEYMDGDDVRIDFIPAPCIYPLSWSSGDIIDCAFASELDDATTYINRHIKQDGRYVIYNHLFDKRGKPLPLPDGVLEEWHTNSERALFQIVKPNAVNNIDISNPMGISVFANALDVLETLDLAYDSFNNEFKLGKKRIFVDSTLVKPDLETGEVIPVFDTNDTVFYGLPGKDNDKSITESNMALRIDEHIKGIQTTLDVLSEKCGFGRAYYKFDADGVKTATEVMSQNSKLFRRVKKDEIILEKALRDMVGVILFLGGRPEDEISISFDDSIIEDTNAIANRAMMELQAGIIDNVEYYKCVYGMEQDAAEELAKQIAARSPANADFFAGSDG